MSFQALKGVQIQKTFFEKKFQFTLYRAEFWLLMFIEVINGFNFWVKSLSQ